MKTIYMQFQMEGTPILCSPFGGGHINHTYLIVTNRSRLYILQDMNTYVFKDIPGVMENVAAVCAHLRQADPDPRHSMRLIPVMDGRTFLQDAEGRYWRMFEYVEGGVCLDQPESQEDFRQCGLAFGMFQNQLADFPAEQLHETIPQFHDTPNRYRQLHQAIDENRAGRLADASAEISGYLGREAQADTLTSLCAAGELPLRVTHNDTKLNNVMLDEATRQPLCVMDLDTVMPGLVANDFGDAIRSGASTAAEDETDLDKVHFDLEMFRAFADGFLSACGNRLTAREIETLPWGAKLMTLECGTRFLADYLNGDVYFHVTHPTHNLERCRTQLRLVEEMEQQWDAMNDAIAEISRKYGLQ